MLLSQSNDIASLSVTEVVVFTLKRLDVMVYELRRRDEWFEIIDRISKCIFVF